MRTVLESAKPLPVYEQADVAVIGGGPAGVGAAVAAARNGAKTVLIETSGFLGGAQVLSLGSFFSQADRQYAGGLMKEILEKLTEAGMLYTTVENGGEVLFDGEYYKLLLDEMAIDAGVQVFFHMTATEGLAGGNRLKGVVVESHQGREMITARMVIDCTGSARIAACSGAGCTQHGKTRGGFDAGVWLYLVNAAAYAEALKTGGSAIEKLLSENGITLRVRPNGRALLVSSGFICGSGEPVSTGELSRCEQKLRERAWSALALLKADVPGFQDAKIGQTDLYPRFSSGRRMIGRCRLTKENLGSAEFEDAVHWGNAAARYEIPLRALVSRDFDNLLAAGGSMDAQADAWEILSAPAASMCVGQVCGTAAALAAAENTVPLALDMEMLRNVTREQFFASSESPVLSQK